jgi:hypothetical protein
MDLFVNHTLSNLKQAWRQTIEGDGGYCPCCGRWGKINAFYFDQTKALALIWMSKQSGEWIDMPKTAPRWILRGKTFSMAALWGLIEKSGSQDNPKKKSDGLWRLTTKGLDFVSGRITIPRKVFTYDRKAEGFSQEEVYIRDCLDIRFDYWELMSEQFRFNSIDEIIRK